MGLGTAFVVLGPILIGRWTLLAVLGAWSLAWIAATVCALRAPRRLVLGTIVVAAIAVRAVGLAGPPSLSDDLYRYAWDGHVQASGVDAYRYKPADPHLVHLRDRQWLWPTARGCRQQRPPRNPGCTLINRANVRTIYPPLAQVWFRTVFAVEGLHHQDQPWKVAAGLVDLATIGLITLALRWAGRDERWVALYALCPAVVLETSSNAHIDGLALLVTLGAVLAAQRRRVWLAGALVGAAALVKLYPALLLPALAVPAGTAALRAWGARVKAGVAFLAVVALGYLPHVVAVGPKVIGYLPGYLQEEHYDTGKRFLLLSLLGLPAGITTALVVVTLGAVVAWVVWRRPPPVAGATVLLGAALLLSTPVQPWYAVVLAGLATVAGSWWWLAVTAAGYPYFFAIILDAAHPVAIGRISYGLALVTVVVAGARSRQRRAARSCDLLDPPGGAVGAQDPVVRPAAG